MKNHTFERCPRPICARKGYYLPELRYRWSWTLQFAPRCKYCQHYLPHYINGKPIDFTAIGEVPKHWVDFKEAQAYELIPEPRDRHERLWWY